MKLKQVSSKENGIRFGKTSRSSLWTIYEKCRSYEGFKSLPARRKKKKVIKQNLAIMIKLWLIK